MNFPLLIQILIIGIASGSIIALIALGYTIVYGIVELINFAHGDVFMLCAFFALTIVSAFGTTGEDPFWQIAAVVLITLALTMAFGGLINFTIDRVAYK